MRAQPEETGSHHDRRPGGWMARGRSPMSLIPESDEWHPNMPATMAGMFKFRGPSPAELAPEDMTADDVRFATWLRERGAAPPVAVRYDERGAAERRDGERRRRLR